MKKRVYIITAIVSYFALLVATIPAHTVSSIINENSPIKIQGVNGTLWQGKAFSIVINNSTQLQASTWSFNAWKLLIGKIAIDVDTQYILNAKISAQDLAQLAEIPMAQLSGMISFNIVHAAWKHGEMPLAEGEINWKDAVVTVAESASLGDLSIVLNESDQQRLNAKIKNQGGDIRISGTAELVSATDYAVNVTLTPTESASNNIKQSLGLFAQKQNNGAYVLKKSGSLNQIM
jgi:general secretion pathway protein N